MARKASHEPRRVDEAQRRPFRWSGREIVDLAKAAGREFVEDKCPKQAAALAYYTLFAIGPLLVIAISIAALAFGSEAARGAVLGELRALLGEAGAEGIASLLASAHRAGAGVIGTIVGSALLLLSAGAVFAQLKDSLDRIWEVEAKKPVGLRAKIAWAVRRNFLSFVGVAGTGFLLLVSLLVSTLVAVVGREVAGALPMMALLAQAVNVLLSLVVVSFVFAALFKTLPDVRVAWRDVLVGATVTATLFLAGQVALGYYLGAGPLTTRYGQGGAFLIVLVWVYYSSMIVFFGAELTQVYANRYGSRIHESRDARPLVEAIRDEQDEPENEGVKGSAPTRTRGRRPA